MYRQTYSARDSWKTPIDPELGLFVATLPREEVPVLSWPSWPLTRVPSSYVHTPSVTSMRGDFTVPDALVLPDGHAYESFLFAP